MDLQSSKVAGMEVVAGVVGSAVEVVAVGVRSVMAGGGCCAGMFCEGEEPSLCPPLPWLLGCPPLPNASGCLLSATNLSHVCLQNPPSWAAMAPGLLWMVS